MFLILSKVQFQSFFLKDQFVLGQAKENVPYYSIFGDVQRQKLYAYLHVICESFKNVRLKKNSQLMMTLKVLFLQKVDSQCRRPL